MAVKVQSTMFYTQRRMNSITLHSVTAMKVTFVCSVSASHENKALLSFDRENFTSHLCWTLLNIRGKLNSVLHGVSVSALLVSAHDSSFLRDIYLLPFMHSLRSVHKNRRLGRKLILFADQSASLRVCLSVC